MEKKLELIAYIESGNKQIDASHHFGYPSSTVKAIWQVREKVKAYSANGHDMTKKKANFSPHQPLDEPLLEWYYKMLDMNVPVTGECLNHADLWRTCRFCDDFLPENYHIFAETCILKAGTISIFLRSFDSK